MNELEKYIEDTQAFLEEMHYLFQGGDALETGVDNLGVSLPYNFYLFGFGEPVLWALGPGIALGIVYGGIHWAFERHHRDSWDGYLARERTRLNRIALFLENLKGTDTLFDKNQLQHLKNLFERYAEDTLKIYNSLGEEYVSELGIYDFSELDKEKILQQILGTALYNSYTNLTQNLSGIEPNSLENPQNQPISIEDLEAAKETYQKKLNAPDISFINSYLFKGIVAYSLAFWLVYYFTMVITPLASLAMPMGWTLLPLLFPLGYLIYKEIESYKKRIIEITDSLPKKPEEEKHNALNFRFLWIPIALIFAISLVGILFASGATPGIIAGIAFGGLFGVLVLGFFVGKVVDHFVAKKQQELLSTNDKVEEETSQHLEERKQHAATRRGMLDELALATYSLVLADKIAQAKKSLSAQIGETYTISPLNKPAAQEELSPKGETSTTEKARLVMSTGVSFLIGYMLGNFAGFVLSDVLLHFTAILVGVPGYLVIGIFSAALGTIFARQAYYTEKIHQTDLDIIAAPQITQQGQLKKLNNEVEQQKAELQALENKKSALRGTLQLTLQDLNMLKDLELPPFTHPIRTEEITLRQVLFWARAALKILAGIAAALLLVRAVLTMSFAQLIPGLAGGSLVLFGTSIGPLGFVVLGLALAVLVIKEINDIYLMAQKQKELESIKRTGFDIKVKTLESDYLKAQIELTQKAYVYLNALNELPESTESHAVLNAPEQHQHRTSEQTISSNTKTYESV